ncbi:MAG: hypothetical protein H0T76_05995 [Nannocystis sp.]|nr:hypothetical protein [Nannocystis sp.]MBA3546012.1 hypothetical protein [Nannocystis sp.]
MKTISTILLALTLSAACDGETSSTNIGSTSDATTGEALTVASTGVDASTTSSGVTTTGPDEETSTTGDASGSTSEGTSGAEPTSTTGDSTGDSSTGEAGACFADECGEDMPCGDNLACRLHPVSGVMVCAASDCSEGPCDGNTAACGAAQPGWCYVNETNHGWCFPKPDEG